MTRPTSTPPSTIGFPLFKRALSQQIAPPPPTFPSFLLSYPRSCFIFQTWLTAPFDPPFSAVLGCENFWPSVSLKRVPTFPFPPPPFTPFYLANLRAQAASGGESFSPFFFGVPVGIPFPFFRFSFQTGLFSFSLLFSPFFGLNGKNSLILCSQFPPPLSCRLLLHFFPPFCWLF